MTVYPRGNVYYLETTVGGKKVKRSTRVTLDEGFEKAKRVAEDISRALQRGHQRITLKPAIARTYKTVWTHNKDSETPLQRATVMLEILGDIPLDSITDETITDLREYLIDYRDLSRATVNRYMATLGVIFTAVSPKDRPKIPKYRESQGRIRYFTQDEEQRLFEYLYATDRDDYADFMVCLLDTGMRFGELNKLLLKDVNFETKQIHVWDNKGDLPRTVPMTTRVHRTLLERSKRVSSDNLWGYDYWGVRWRFRVAKDAIGLADDKDVCLHTFRHTCASRLVQAGVSLYVVQKILGHSSIKITEKYAHLNTETLHEAMVSLETIPPETT